MRNEHASTCDDATVREIIRRHVPYIALHSIRMLPHFGWGGGSDAYLVNDQWIFRFPRSPEVAERLAVEVCLLPQLAPNLAIPIPRLTYVVRSETGLPLFVGYPRIRGEPLRREMLGAVDLEVAERLAEQLGAFLSGLHRIPIQAGIHCGLTPPPQDLRAHWSQVEAHLRAKVYPVLARDERRWVSHRFSTLLADSRFYRPAQTICHGDLSSDHILFDPASGNLTGVIDFGDLRIGDPAADFAWRGEYGDEFFRKVLAHYAPSTDNTFPERVTFHLDRMPLFEIEYGVETGFSEYVLEGRKQLRQRMNLGHPARS